LVRATGEEPKEFCEWLEELLTDLSSLSTKRHAIIHGAILDHKELLGEAAVFQKFSWSNPTQIESNKLTIEDIRFLAIDATCLALNLLFFSGQAFKLISQDELDKILGKIRSESVPYFPKS
jgi:hypothetical protein